jgi:N-dimethylarginine dimethylaminohydrolase
MALTTNLSLMASQAGITVRDVQHLGGILSNLRNPEAPARSPLNLVRADRRLGEICGRMLSAGLVDHAMMFETCDSPELVDLALTATLGLFVSIPGQVGAAAMEALGRGAGLSRKSSPPAPPNVCMSLEMIRTLLRSPDESARAAEAVRSGKLSKRPVFSVAPPGAGFGDWFGKQMYSADAKDAVKYPAKALGEWGRYVDTLSEHAEVFVIPYACDRDSTLWRIVYTANGPQFLEIGGALYAILPNLSHLGRQGEHRWFQDYALQLGVPADHILQPLVFQEGQADFARPIPRKGKKPLLFLGYGIRTPTTQPYEEMRRVRIGKGANAAVVDLLQNYETEYVRMNPNSYAFHQDTWLNLVRNREGRLFAMYAPSWIHPDDRARFAARLKTEKIPAIILSDVDAMSYAANANEVDGTVFLVKGGAFEVSAELKRKLKKAGFSLLELEFDELYGKAGGGTRCMVNEIRDIDRDRQREFFARLEFFRYVPGSWERLRGFYPERYEPKQAAPRKTFTR